MAYLETKNIIMFRKHSNFYDNLVKKYDEKLMHFTTFGVFLLLNHKLFKIKITKIHHKEIR